MEKHPSESEIYGGSHNKKSLFLAGHLAIVKNSVPRHLFGSIPLFDRRIHISKKVEKQIPYHRSERYLVLFDLVLLEVVVLRTIDVFI